MDYVQGLLPETIERLKRYPVQPGTTLSPGNSDWALGYAPPKGWEDEPGIVRSKAVYDALIESRGGEAIHLGRSTYTKGIK